MIIQLLKNLINARSTCHTGELESAKVLQDFFTANGISAAIDCWDGNRANITAHIKGSKSEKAVLFASHLDVVPEGEGKWDHPPFNATEADSKIYGRGASDMKAGNAAIAAAAVEIIKSGIKLKNDLIISSTAGEETDSCGAIKFIEKYQNSLPNIEGIILPEPTDFEIITGHRGIYWLKITTTGKTAHGSMPHLGINAINSMAAVLEKLKSYHPKCKAGPDFGISTVSVNQIQGGKATNVIPDNCEIQIDIRTVPDQNTELIKQDLQKIFEDIKKQMPHFDAKTEVIRKVAGMETDSECEFVNKLKKTTGIKETKIVGYTTDGPIFQKLNAPVVVFGPGKTELAHQPNEYVDIEDLHKAVDYYKKIILSFLK